MILEILHYLASLPPTSPAHRPFVRGSVNLWSRARRCAKDWAAHEAACHAAIDKAVADCRQRRTAVVLGSGLLRDVDMAMLSKRFDTVVLIDRVHLFSVRVWLKAKRLRNVRLIERDISGLDAIKGGEEPAPLAFLRQVPYLDLVISANVLSQIGVGTSEIVEKKGLPSDTVPRLIAAHIAGLDTLPCPALLLTDIAFQVIDRTGRVHQEADLMHGVAIPPETGRWLWPVLPTGEASADYQVVHTVISARLGAIKRGNGS